MLLFFFFFQAEDGIRDRDVTGVQTCALPISGIPGLGRKLPALHSPRHGDVVVFVFPVDPTRNYVKRIAGVPGDTLEMRDGILVRNGKRVNERYAQHIAGDPDDADGDFRWQTAY